MDDEDRVFKALADSTRRFLLDLLFERDGRTLTELESELEMTRFGVMKHLRVLEEAGVVVTRRDGRQKLHFLNPVPIRLVHDRWIDKYTEHRVAALADLKHELEETAGARRRPPTSRRRRCTRSSSSRPRSRSGTRSRSRSSRSATSTASGSSSATDGGSPRSETCTGTRRSLRKTRRGGSSTAGPRPTTPSLPRSSRAASRGRSSSRKTGR